MCVRVCFCVQNEVNAVDVVMFGDRKVLADMLEARKGGGGRSHPTYLSFRDEPVFLASGIWLITDYV